MEYGHQQEETPLKRYTKEELNAKLDQAERNFATGLGIPGEDVFRELEEEFALEDAKEELLLEAV